MKILIIYDSKFGNTEKVARDMGSLISKQDKVEVKHVNKVCATDFTEVDFLIVGTPTHGFNSSEDMRAFLKTLEEDALKGIKVATFDTRTEKDEIESKWFLKILVGIFGYAAKPLSKRLVSKGGDLVKPYAGFEVKGKEGPLVKGELKRAKDWCKEVRSKI